MTGNNDLKNVSIPRKYDEEKKNCSPDVSQKKAARVAGLFYLLIIMSSLFFMAFIDPISSFEGKTSEAVDSIIDNELMFRIQIFYELFMYAGVMILAYALLKVLKPVNKSIASMAAIFRLGEAIVGIFAVIMSISVLVILNSESTMDALGIEQTEALAGLFLDIGSSTISVIFIFIAMGTIMFCYLFYRSRYIPRVISVFGMLSFTLILIWASMDILTPDLAADVQMIFLPWSILFEISIGFWLLIKGIKIDDMRTGEVSKSLPT